MVQHARAQSQFRTIFSCEYRRGVAAEFLSPILAVRSEECRRNRISASRSTEMQRSRPDTIKRILPDFFLLHLPFEEGHPYEER